MRISGAALASAFSAAPMASDKTPALWIKDPLAILADEAERGIVVQDGRIAELIAAGREPRTPGFQTFDAGAHVVLPGPPTTTMSSPRALKTASISRWPRRNGWACACF